MAIRRRRSKLSRSARLVAGSSVLLGLVLTGAGIVQSFSDAASAAPPGVGQQLGTDTGGYSEYSICAGVASSAPCSLRGQPGGTEVQGAIAVNGNFRGFNFYIGNLLSNTQSLAVAGNVGGTLAILGAGNGGVYGGTNTAQLPPAYCSSGPCLLPNLFPASPSNPLPAFSAINSDLTTESATLGAMPTTAGDSVAWDQAAGTLTLTGTNTQENVFDLAGAGSGVLAGTTDLYINVPPGSSTVINVPEPSVNCSSTACLQIVYYWDGSVYEAGNMSPTPTVQALMANTVVNFPSATSVTLSSAGPALNFLAPDADFTFFNGNIFGFIYANQVNGTFENEIPPMGTIPSTTTTSTTTTSTTPTSSTTTTIGTGGSTSTTSTTSSTTSTTAATTTTVVTVPNTPGTVGTTTSTTLPTTTTVPTTTALPTTTAAPTTTTSTTAPTTSTTVLASTSTTVRTHAHSATTTTTAPAATTTTAPAATTTTAPAATTTTAAAATTTTAPAATTTVPAATTTTAPAATTTTVRTHAHHATTTVPAATTTTAPAATTTTAPAATTTTAAAATTTAPASTTTTAPASTTTTAPASTTTTAPAATTTTAPAATTTTTTPKTLALTGSDSSTMVGWGLGLILLGGSVVAFSYRRRALP